MTATQQPSTTRKAPIQNPGYGESFTDHMFSVTWSPELGWHDEDLCPMTDLVHPGTIGLHYGQVAFEGLKAYRVADGSVAVFRPHDHARRFQTSTRRLAMPDLPVDVFLRSINQVVAADESLLSDNPDHSIYLRPLMFGTDRSLMLRPSKDYRYLMMALIADGFFGRQLASVSVLISREYTRAFPGGTGNVKFAGNYAPTFVAQRQAEQAGCQQVVWLDAVERRWVEELGGMNLFFVRGSGPGAEIVTPVLSGSLLPGVTRDTLLTVASRLGYTPREEKVSVTQWREECESGRITEVFACGTSAVVTPVSHVKDTEGPDWQVGDGTPGPVTLAVRRHLVDLHHGLVPDPSGWLHRPTAPR